MTHPLEEDLRTRWLPSSGQMALANAVLSSPATPDRGVYTAHLLVGKTYGFWSADVEVVPLDGVFLTRDAVLDFVQVEAENYHRRTGQQVTGGYAWHAEVGHAAVWEDICSQFPQPSATTETEPT